MPCHRTYGLAGLGTPIKIGDDKVTGIVEIDGQEYDLGPNPARVIWIKGKAYDTHCNMRQPIRYGNAGQLVWAMSSASGWSAKPIMNPAQVPCGARQGDIKVTSVGKAVGVAGDIAKHIPHIVAISAGAVALSSMGAGVVKGASGALTGGTSAAGTAAGAANATRAADLFSQIQAKGNKILNYINQGRTIHAIANGELPPPPISIQGSSFTEWALMVAQDEMIKSHNRKMTRAEEEAMRREIEAMQNEMAARVPESFPKAPDPAIPAPVQQRQIEIVEKNKSDADTMKTALMVGIPLLALIALKG